MSEMKEGEARPDGPPPAQGRRTHSIRKGPKGAVDRYRIAKEEATGPTDFCCRLCACFSTCMCGIACCSISIALLIAIPLALLVVGVIHLHDCSVQRYIPIWMIVTGVFGILKALFNLGVQCRNYRQKKSESSYDVEADDEELKKPEKPNVFVGLIALFLFCWFICGCVWVYGVYNYYQTDDPASQYYCHKGTYLFSFWVITISLAFMALSIVLCCCGSVIAFLCGRN